MRSNTPASRAASLPETAAWSGLITLPARGRIRPPFVLAPRRWSRGSEQHGRSNGIGR